MATEYIKTELAKYNLPDAKIAEMKADYMPLVVSGAEDTENYLICKEAHQIVKKIRGKIEDKRVELKAGSLEFGRAVDTEAKRLTCGVKAIEDHLLEQRKVVEDEKKRLQEEAENNIRKEEARVKKEEEDRLEKQRRDQEETERKQREAQDKIDAQTRKIEEDKESNRLEAERLAREKQEEKDRLEREKRHAEEVKKAEEEAKAQAIKDEQDRVAQEAKEKADKEKADKKEAERQAELAPDKEKISVLANSIDSLVFPEVKSEEARRLLEATGKRLEVIVDALNDFNA